MKSYLLIFALISFSLSLPIVYDSQYEDGAENVVIDFKPFLSSLLKTLKSRLSKEDKSFHLPDFQKDFEKDIGLFTAHANVSLTNGTIYGLETLIPEDSKLITEPTLYILETKLLAKDVLIKYSGIIGVDFLTFFTTHVDVNVNVNNITVHVQIAKNLTDEDPKPHLKSLEIEKLSLNVTLNAHWGSLSWVGNKIANYLANFLVKQFDLRDQIANVMRPMVQKVIDAIKLPINGMPLNQDTYDNDGQIIYDSFNENDAAFLQDANF